MMTLAELTRRMYERYAEAPAVFDGTGWLTFRELDDASKKTASHLLALGAVPADRVVVALRNRPETLMLDHACFRAGFVRVSLSSRLHGREIADIVRDCGASVAVVEDEHVSPLIEAELPGLQATVSPSGEALTLDDLAAFSGGEVVESVSGPDDLAALMYTSGTTGEPKGAMVSHRGWVSMVRGFWAALPPFGPGDVILHVAPMSHFGGSAGSAATFNGAAIVPVERFDPTQILRLVRDLRVTVLPLVPTMLKELTVAAEDSTESLDVSSLRAIPYGGAGISARALSRAQEVFGEVLYQCYGLSEALAPLTVLSARDHSYGPGTDEFPALLSSAGRPMPEIELSVVDDSGAPVPDGESGEVRIRSTTVMDGYWNRPEESSKVLDKEGWFRTGDVGYVDAGGYLYLVDRKRDIIVSGGFTVYPAEVERAIAEHPGVYDVVVVGVPHERWGEAVAAVVVPAAGASLTPEDVIDACRSRLASFKKPVSVEFVEQLPLSSTGKVQRRDIQNSYWRSSERRIGS